MSSLRFQDKDYSFKSEESVLDTLLRHGMDIPFSCKTGVCNTCLMVCKKGNVPISALKGLNDKQINMNIFLACQCESNSLAEVSLPDDYGLFGRAKIRSIKALTLDIFSITIEPATALYYHAGQYINLRRSDGLTRSYSICNTPTSTNDIELHVKRMPNGKMSNWLSNPKNISEGIDIEGPNGSCYYQPESTDKEIILAGTGVALSPLIGILHDALQSGHQGEIKLVHGIRNKQDNYCESLFKELALDHHNFVYEIIEYGIDNNAGLYKTLIKAVQDKIQNLTNTDVYLCGGPDFIKPLKTDLYLSGLNLNNIFVDNFVYKELRTHSREEG